MTTEEASAVQRAEALERELAEQREEMSRLNVQLAASQAARETLRTSLSQVTRRWQYWARVFGYSAPGLLTPPECERWILAEEQRSAPLTEYAVVPRERLIQDPITLTV